jgi:hypothetical protein
VQDMERAGVDVDHRRRDAARELLEPLRDALDGVDLDRPASRSTAPATRTRCRASSGRSARAARRGARRRVPPLDHDRGSRSPFPGRSR